MAEEQKDTCNYHALDVAAAKVERIAVALEKLAGKWLGKEQTNE